MIAMFIVTEPEITFRGERWVYGYDPVDGFVGYVHLGCDAETTKDGLCVMCGQSSPSAMR